MQVLPVHQAPLVSRPVQTQLLDSALPLLAAFCQVEVTAQHKVQFSRLLPLHCLAAIPGLHVSAEASIMMPHGVDMYTLFRKCNWPAEPSITCVFVTCVLPL